MLRSGTEKFLDVRRVVHLTHHSRIPLKVRHLIFLFDVIRSFHDVLRPTNTREGAALAAILIGV